ncbi:hypothetical protein PF005_g2883 [Phytophthora fragariae]|uniref:Uncharacterized protein n=1 Tax=Phytophthora fragariae TaxID=53985 RepID=A0A6A3T2W7_9STRA|nr:hypothetical protein PF003_g4370 [Phytophthora fragariae]KAE8948285.1 hypothetical protein PF009_g2129 [Phytophthora fragariae]KAE8998622.1 hypothetical protein PF011_g14973 [Phytophthora fragariae]KAE9128169.1 hypothetical protein PF006_g16345 [Phytophthora fragariae]KAE9134604.1 hypothetical protein PF007_g2862 [Phytophthora fragariae]
MQRELKSAISSAVCTFVLSLRSAANHPESRLPLFWLVSIHTCSMLSHNSRPLRCTRLQIFDSGEASACGTTGSN